MNSYKIRINKRDYSDYDVIKASTLSPTNIIHPVITDKTIPILSAAVDINIEKNAKHNA